MKVQLVHMRDKLSDDDKVSGGIVEKIVKQSKADLTLLKPSKDKDETMVLSKKLTDLVRNMKAIEEEKGIHDFYLGFPFLTGTLQNGTFYSGSAFLISFKTGEKHC
ncbi:hypothetical protein ABN702_15995 [Bacillus haimaensis]|uniref:hypothetical protein n=1 Tax=Bacillus haimaensis TaxID=3160967 RepID=UPI003AA7AE18